mgnify:CR=1 FL=1
MRCNSVFCKVKKGAAHLRIGLYLLIIASMIGCSKPRVPREYGYFRVFLPEHTYQATDNEGYPYRFEVSDFAQIHPVTQAGEKYWIDIVYPKLNAHIHCSYKPIQHNLGALSADAEEFVYNHSMKATSIPEQEYADDSERVYAVMYHLEGNTATPTQFYITDSTQHFFRGALYFNCIPNQDSLAPMIEYLREDITHLIETIRWTY